MNHPSLQRLDELVGLGARGVPTAQQAEWQRAFDEALDAAKAAGAAPREIYQRALRAPTFGTRLRSLITVANYPTPEQAEDAKTFYDALGIADGRRRAVVLTSVGLPRALAERLRALALADEGKIE